MTGRPRALREWRRQSSGFAVTELAIAIALAVVLVAVGVSAYRTYVVRAQVASTVQLSAPVRQRVASAFTKAGVPPRDSGEAGLPADAHGVLGPHVASLAVSDGRIEIRFDDDLAELAIAGQSLYLTPFETASRDVVWVCGNALPGPGLQPLGFAGGARRAVQVLTTIDARYLPSACR